MTGPSNRLTGHRNARAALPSVAALILWEIALAGLTAGSALAAALFSTVGVYDPLDAPRSNQVDYIIVGPNALAPAYSNGVAQGDLGAFTQAVAKAFVAGVGGVIDFEGPAPTNVVSFEATYAAGTKKIRLTSNGDANPYGLQNRGSDLRRQPVSGSNVLGKANPASYYIDLALISTDPDEKLFEVGFTLINRAGSGPAYNPVGQATFDDGSMSTAQWYLMGHEPGGTKDTFFHVKAPPGRHITHYGLTLGQYTGIDDFGFITGTFPARWRGTPTDDKWAVNANWIDVSVFPDAVGKQVFVGDADARSTVDTEASDRALGALTFESGVNTEIMSTASPVVGRLLLTNSGAATAVIAVSGAMANHRIAVPVVLGSGTETVVGPTNAGSGLEISGAVSGAGFLRKVGAGALVLGGACTYSGLTTVNAGMLMVNGSLTSAVAVNSGGTLGGTGSIDSAVAVAAGGTLQPGVGSTGVLTATNLTMTSGSVFRVSCAGGTCGRLFVPAGGAADLGGAALAVAGAPDVMTLTLVSSGAHVVGTFDGLAEGAKVPGLHYTISYQGGPGGTDVVLRQMPGTLFMVR